jgi:hypothetical protein
MRKFTVLLILILVVSSTYSNKLKINPISNTVNANTSPKGDNDFIYKLFPTQNLWTFIKLNTRNGQMWQVQYDTKENNRLETSLNLIPLVIKEDEINNRFTLYPTQNIYTFILLDQLDGRTWQVQWSTNAKERLVIPIE